MIALALILVARPLAVVASALPFSFRPRELIFLSWVGLKGAVPITLATFPLMAGVPGSEVLFDAVFFVVLISAITQGWSLPIVARCLKLGRPADPAPPLTVEINALRHVDGEIVDYAVAPSARVAGQLLRDLALPDGAVVTLVVRETEVIMPRGATALRPGDHVFVAMRTRLKPLLDRLFDPDAEALSLRPGITLGFSARSTAGQLQRFFGIPGPTWSAKPVGSLLNADGERRAARLGPFAVTPSDEPDFVTLTYSPGPGDPEEGGTEPGERALRSARPTWSGDSPGNWNRSVIALRFPTTGRRIARSPRRRCSSWTESRPDRPAIAPISRVLCSPELRARGCARSTKSSSKRRAVPSRQLARVLAS